MKFLTGYFCCANLHSSLVLQQATRRRGKLPVVFAFVWEGKMGGIRRETGGTDVAREMTEWFYEKALEACTGGDEAACVDAVQRLFVSKAGEVNGEFAALFAVGRECFYVWRGGVEIHLLNLCFNRLNRKGLTYLSEELCVERARIEEGIGLILGSARFFAKLPEQLLKECLDVATLESSEQVERHLREAAEASGRHGAEAFAEVSGQRETEELAVILVVAKGE